MRNLKVYCAILFVFVLLSLIAPAVDAQTYETLNPPVTRIELSRTEVPPPGVAQIVAWGGYGGGEDSLDSPNTPHWALYPDDIYNDIKACGYSNSSLSSAVLELPSGRTRNLSTVLDRAKGCWSYSVDWEYGMELGNYSLYLDAPQGSLEHHWIIDYPDQPTVVCFPQPRENGTLQALLMGFSPRTTLTLHFYTLVGDNSENRYITSRNVRADDKGTVGIDVTSTRSSGYADHQVGFSVEGYISDEDIAADTGCSNSVRYPYRHLYTPSQRHTQDRTAEIQNTWVDYDVVQNNEMGMRIHVAFDVSNLRDQIASANVYFYYAAGEPLKDFDGLYNTTDGYIATHRDFSPPYIKATYSDFSLF
ncbi:MAG: hypothetical protein GC204_14060, partial [Chloroflexi bacterium]|nr:hypothetical protein [Chloroflexota bacterium]